MKKSIALAGAFAAGVLLPGFFGQGVIAQNLTPPHTTLKVGDMAPDFTLPATTPQGAKVTLSSFRGKNVVVLAFFPAAFTGG